MSTIPIISNPYPAPPNTTINTAFTVTYTPLTGFWKFTFATNPDPLNKWVNNEGFSFELVSLDNNPAQKYVLITDETTTDYQAFTVDYTLCTSPSGAGISAFTWMSNVASLFV
jgi:hypothetical protein